MPLEKKDASEHTKKLHHTTSETLNFADIQDFKDADRGLIAAVENPINKLSVEDRKAPYTVNPSLWRNTQLQAKAGLYEVVEGIYQIRGLSLATTIIVEGETGIIVVDTLTSFNAAKQAMELYYEHRPKKPVVAIIISQSHSDHFNGTEAVMEYAEHAQIPIIVPENFAKEAFSENVLLGPIMNRRSVYQFGLSLPTEEKGFINAGIGSVFGVGRSGFVLPNDEIKDDYEQRTIDGIEFDFLLTPNTEAPVEMHIYIKTYKALFVSENANKTLHQLYTVRGAKARDTLEWVAALDKTIEMFEESDIDVLIMIHAWPIWGKKNALNHLSLQRDLYKYIHDQTVRLANKGLTMDEIAETLTLPDSLGKYWGNRDYYGTVKHNAKGVYNFYLGYYNGHPSDLDSLPQVEAGKKYVQYMGGADNIIKKAQEDFNNGEYRWVAEVLKHVVMADENNEEAKQLLADTYEQLGYQAESANWRNIYLVGAQELRHGIPQVGRRRSKRLPKMIKQMPFSEFHKLLSVRLDAEKAIDQEMIVNVHFTDEQEQYSLYIKNCVLNLRNRKSEEASITLKLTKPLFYKIMLHHLDIEEVQTENQIELSADKHVFEKFQSLFDYSSTMIPIVTP